MTASDRPLLEYPLDWTFKIVGTDEQDLRRAAKVMLAVCLDSGSGDRAYQLEPSRTSSSGTYTSLNLTLEVRSQAERDALFAGLRDCPEVLMVL